MQIRSDSYTDKGIRARINQDAVVNLIGNSVSVFCIADGMGGHQHGELASKSIADKLSKWQKRVDTQEAYREFGELLDDFENTVAQVNQQIYEDYNQFGICGSTLAALVIFQSKYAVFSAGDSRVYLKRKWHFSQMTTDDVWQNHSGAVSGMSSAQILKDPNYGKLTKSIGATGKVLLSRMTGDLRRNDMFFLCCDGVHKLIPDKKLKRIISKKEKIKKSVIKAGAPDNYSYITVWIK